MRGRSKFSLRQMTMLVGVVVVGAIAIGLVSGAGAATQPGAAGYGYDCVGNHPPSASFTYSPIPPAPGQTITFTSTSSDPDGDALDIVWDFNNDGVEDASGPQATHSFPAGDHIVGIGVFDECGEFAAQQRAVHVEAPAQPPPDTAGPTVPISSANKTLPVSRNGVFTFVLGPFAEDVTGNVSFTTVKAFAAAKKKRLTLGTKNFTAAKGKRARVKVKLGRKARRALKKAKRMRVRARILARDGLGNATKRTATFTIKAPKKKKKRG